MARDMAERNSQFLGRQLPIQRRHPKLPRVQFRKAQSIAMGVAQKSMLLKKFAELRHALAPPAHDTSHAAKLAAKLVGGGSFLVGFGCIEGPHPAGNDPPLRHICFDQRPPAGGDAKINPKALHRLLPIHSRRKRLTEGEGFCHLNTGVGREATVKWFSTEGSSPRQLAAGAIPFLGLDILEALRRLRRRFRQRCRAAGLHRNLPRLQRFRHFMA